MIRLVHAVMCGGSGTRLWPWSRQSWPKQFLTLLGERSLLQATIDRMGDYSGPIETIVIGQEEHRFLMAEQLRSTQGAPEILLEPAQRSTAAVALVAAIHAQSRFGDDCAVLLAPADHIITDTPSYFAAIESGIAAAQDGYLVTFGTKPTGPQTGYGYIEVGDPFADGSGVHQARSFREKPDEATAKAFIESGGFLWNAGIFLFSPDAVLTAAAALHPRLLAKCRSAYENAVPDLDFLRLDAEPYRTLETISFDYAFAERMESTVAVVPVSMGWSDIGSWRAFYEARSGEIPDANVVEGPAELFDCRGTLAISDGPLLVAQGIDDTVIVANHDAVYVAAADQTEKVKSIVEELTRNKRREAVTHARVFRPWGWYQVINFGEDFQVKEISVKPGGQLSLQSHSCRAEHWVVVQGLARVTIEDDVKTIEMNESVYIPLGARHRLENPGDSPLHVIEVQTGTDFSEDDIIRYADRYGRE